MSDTTTKDFFKHYWELIPIPIIGTFFLVVFAYAFSLTPTRPDVQVLPQHYLVFFIPAFTYVMPLIQYYRWKKSRANDRRTD